MTQLKPLVDDSINLRDLMRFCSVGENGNWMYLSFLTNFVDWISDEEMKLQALDHFNTFISSRFEYIDSLRTEFSNSTFDFLNKKWEIIYSFKPLSNSSSISQFLQGPISTSLMKFLFSVEMNWPVILIGDRGSGKSSLIKQAAAIAGVNLQSMSLTASSDISDIIGSFEQKTFHSKVIDEYKISET